jgi:preprotein translocase subunit SecE
MSINSYINETKAEMKHVAWPTRKQTTLYSLLVVLISILTAAYLGIFDYIFTFVFKFILPTIN